MAAALCAPGAVSPGAVGSARSGAAHPSAAAGPSSPEPATLGAPRADPGALAGTKFMRARSLRSLPRPRTLSRTNHLTGADVIIRLEETWGTLSSSSNPAPITWKHPKGLCLPRFSLRPCLPFISPSPRVRSEGCSVGCPEIDPARALQKSCLHPRPRVPWGLC